MEILEKINFLRDELHNLIVSNPELKRQQVIECSERLDKLIHAYLLFFNNNSQCEVDPNNNDPL